MHLPQQHGIIIAIPEYILGWYEDLHSMSRDDALSTLISKYGSVQFCNECEWEIKYEFETNNVLVRLWSNQKIVGLEALAAFCHYPRRNLYLNALLNDYTQAKADENAKKTNV